jgi:hypothetical protein
MKIVLKIWVIVPFLSCNIPPSVKPNTISISSTLSPEVEQLFSKFTSDLPQQAIVFSFIKFGNGGVTDLLLIAKKPDEIDFSCIGIPLCTIEINERKILLYSGLEQFLIQNQPYTAVSGLNINEQKLEDRPLEITDPPTIKSVHYRVKEGKATTISDHVSDFIFILPPKDTVRFIEGTKRQIGLNSAPCSVLSIKNDLLEGYYCIYISQNGKESLLLSKKTDKVDCDKPIQVSDQLSINLEKVYKVNLNDGLTWNLYSNNFYENGQLVFKKDMDVFMSNNLNNLCILKDR